MRAITLIAWSVLIEAVRRREVYAVVLVSTLLIGAVMTVDFFHIEGLTKFYREVALRIMSLAAALTTIILAARQLPREFEARTIYPLLAKPVSRAQFLAGKITGVMCAAAFCFVLFMAVYLAGALYLGTAVPWAIFAQYIYLQLVMLLIIATLSFWLSMVMNFDAAVTLGVVFFAGSEVLSATMSYVYDSLTAFGRVALVVFTFIIPQLTLFDLSGKAVHSNASAGPAIGWDPLSARVMIELTIYGGVFALLYSGLALFCFRRRPL